MAAYAALVSLQQTTDLILNYDKYYSISEEEREHISSIGEYASFLISFLEDLPEKATRLEGKIRDLANEAEDLIDHFMWSQYRINWWSIGLSRVELKQQLKRLKEEIGSMAGDMMDDRPAAVSSSNAVTKGETDVVIGLDDDLREIIGRLYGNYSALELIPIVGMGGIGKTTLARKAYDDSLIIERFDIRVWITVSQDYKVDEILSRLLESMKMLEFVGEDKCFIAEKVYKSLKGRKMLEFVGDYKRFIAEEVYKSLKGRRYLIVMDDIWSTDSWDDLKCIFPDDKNGSRIMLTTRLSHVAAYASSGCPVHEMKFMDGNASWNLLKQKVFSEDEDYPHELEVIGKEISKGCGGLPLAVVLVAGILSTIVQTKDSWMKIKHKLNSVIGEQLGKILSLSYMVLPHHLRPCFLFMGGFREKHTIHVSRLTKLWDAEGFLKHHDKCKSLEETAEECVEDLVKRSLVLITSRKSNGKIKSCRLHDLVRDMCIRKAEEEKFLLMNNYALANMRKDERRIGNYCSDDIWGPNIRTILCSQSTEYSSLDFVVNFRFLRVLNVMHCYYEELHPHIFELFYLRYLAVGLRHEIPAGISKLENLQTLIICRRSISMAIYLPMEIWRMQHLRYLVFTNFRFMLPYPAHEPTLFPLHNLQTLSGIAVSVCSQSILEMIPNLKKLGIFYYNCEEHHHQLQNLVHLHHLEKLKITSPVSFSLQGKCPVFPRRLKKLSLDGGRLPWKDINSIVGALCHLQVLKLRNSACDGETWETADGEFRQLTYLLLEGLDLQYWITESIHFPRLRRLVLNHCRYFSAIPDSIGEIATLEMIEVETRIESLVKSVKQIQEDQRDFGKFASGISRRLLESSGTTCRDRGSHTQC